MRRVEIDRSLWALFALLTIYYVATRGIFEGKASGDGLLGFLYLPGLVYDHNIDLAHLWPDRARYLGKEATGLVANPCPIGPVLLWLPPYLLGQALRAVLAPLPVGGNLGHWVHALPVGRSTTDYFIAGLGSLGAGCAGLALLLRLLRRHLTADAARFGVWGAALATPLCWYLITQPLYQHAASFFAVALLLERWDAYRGDLTARRCAALGALGGLAMLMRLQEAVWLLLPGLDLLAQARDALRQRGRLAPPLLRGLLLCGAAALTFAPQLLLWRYYYGALRPAQLPGHMRWGNPALLETLWSMRAGLLPWAPILYLALPGLLLPGGPAPALRRRLALLFGLVFYVNASAWDYHGSWAFGPRRFVDATPAFALGLAALHARLRRPRLLWALCLMLILYNLLLMELVRARRLKSAASGAFPAATWVRWGGGPAVLAALVDRVGYPFAQPVGWLYALWHRAPVRTFEGIVGNYILERDWKVREVVFTPTIDLTTDTPYVVERGGPRLRALVPLMAPQALRVTLHGDLRGYEGEVRVRWNGADLPAQAGRSQLRFEVPARLTHSRAWLNTLQLDGLPRGAALRRLDFASDTIWWR